MGDLLKNKVFQVAMVFFVIYISTSMALASSRSYSSGRYGLAFEYPASYQLDEKEVGNMERTHHVITLTDKAFLPLPTDGDGPVSMTIDIFENDRDSLSSEDFIRTTANSNYKLGGGVIASTSYGELTGLEYGWSGLYEGRSLVVARPGYVFMFSVTHQTSNDPILKDFKDILATVILK